MISYSERESRYEWSVEVQQALAFAVQCVGLRHASALHPGPEEGEGEDMGDDLSCYCCHVGSQGLLPVCSACMHLADVHCCPGLASAGKGLGVLQRLAKQPGLLQACKSVVTACMAAIEREVWQEVQLLGEY